MVELAELLPDLMSAAVLKWTPSPAVRTGAYEPMGDTLARHRTLAFPSADLPPALLAVANYNGTLAAVRALGRAGIRVTTADPSRFAVSAWSKYSSARVHAPSVRSTERFLDWLIAFGRSHERHVLLPTSDDTAWLYALHREQLSQYFYLASPSHDVIYRLLNKTALYEEAAAVGIAVPRTWFPESADDLDRCCREARFPVLVKPRTQVMFRTQSKGVYVDSPGELAHYYGVIAGQPHEAGLLTLDPSAARPMVQEFHREAAAGIYNISAYVRRGHICGVRAARKLLQQPRRLGTGVCFEEAAIEPDLLAGLQRLMIRLRYSGVFEAEFIQTKNASVLIDFNPRFYNQMAFDIARGLPLPQLAYYDAIGDIRTFDELSASTEDSLPTRGRVFVDLIALRILLTAQRLSGALSRDEHKKWTDWYARHRHTCTYAIIDSTDRWPFFLAAMQTMLRYARHPRNFFRSIVLNRY